MRREDLSRGSLAKFFLFTVGVMLFGPLAFALILFSAAKDSKSMVVFSIQSLSWAILAAVSMTENSTKDVQSLSVILANGVIIFWMTGLFTVHAAPKAQKRVAAYVASINIMLFHLYFFITLPITHSKISLWEVSAGLIAMILSAVSFSYSDKRVTKPDTLFFAKENEIFLTYISFLLLVSNTIIILTAYAPVVQKYQKLLSGS